MIKKVKLQSYVLPFVSPIILLQLGTGDTMRSKSVMGSPLAYSLVGEFSLLGGRRQI